eukprot:s705_g19.t1
MRKRPASALVQRGASGGSISVKEAKGVKRDNSWKEVKLVEVSGEDYSALARGSGDQVDELAFPRRNRGTRVRFPPLEAWRNERVVFERPHGSSAPQMRGVILNTAADPGLDAWAERAKDRAKCSDVESIQAEPLLALEDLLGKEVSAKGLAADEVLVSLAPKKRSPRQPSTASHRNRGKMVTEPRKMEIEWQL